MHILSNISTCKDNQIMKPGQLIEYNMRNIFLEKSYTKCGWETSPRFFSKKSKLRISLDQQPTVLYNFFFILPSWGLSKCIETKLQTTCFYLILRFFKKQTEICNWSPCLIICIYFFEYYQAVFSKKSWR